jgi:hypothetical protein
VAIATSVVDLHHLHRTDQHGGGSPVLVQLLCHTLKLNRSCAAARGNELEILDDDDDDNDDDEGRNSRFDYEDEDMLAVHARRQGLYPSADADMSRQEAWIAVRDHRITLEKNGSSSSVDLLKQCPSPASLQAIGRLSSALEARVLPIIPGWESDHRAGFEHAVRQNKFCHVDADRTLQDPAWLDFFRPEAGGRSLV